jgi:hypothetical protein
MEEGSLAEGEQIHGSGIRTVSRGGSYRGTDGFITSSENTGLAISTADCCPIFIYSPPEDVLAALHVGRKGAAAGIIPAAMERLRSEFRISPPLSVAVTGPAICRRCYRINGRIASEFSSEVVSEREGEFFLDLPGAVRHQLMKEGIPPGNIFSSPVCTSCDRESCFSHRRDRGRTGRHWSVAFMRERQ